MDQKLVTLVSFDTPAMAHLAQGRLEAEGIECYIADENIVSLVSIISNIFGGIKVQVKESDAQRAARILEQVSTGADLAEESTPDGAEMADDSSGAENRYTAAGAVVTDGERILVLHRPSRGEIRLPKGHVRPGESPQQAALREVSEESGCGALSILADLGTQTVEFDRQGVHVVRREHYFLMATAAHDTSASAGHEEQFHPEWVSWDDAERLLTFQSERNWVRRARERIAPRSE